MRARENVLTLAMVAGLPQHRNDAAAVLVQLSGEPEAMLALAETPGTFAVLVDMLGLASPSACESAATLLYR